jgi:hypothetical protein
MDLVSAGTSKALKEISIKVKASPDDVFFLIFSRKEELLAIARLLP